MVSDSLSETHDAGHRYCVLLNDTNGTFGLGILQDAHRTLLDPRFFWPRNFFLGRKKTVWWAQTKNWRGNLRGLLLFVASGASKNMLIYQSLLIVK